MRRRSFLTALGVASAVATGSLAGCSGEETAAQDPAALLATARTTLEGAKFVTLTLTSQKVPTGVDGVTAAEGTGEVSATEPKFGGSFTGRIEGISGKVGVIAIGPDTWLKLFTDSYEPFDLSTVGAPNPATFFDPKGGLAAMVGSTTAPVLGGQVRQGSEVLTEVKGKLPGAQIDSLLKLGDGTSEFDVTYGIAANGELRNAVAVGPFYAGATSTYVIALKDYGKAVEIARP